LCFHGSPQSNTDLIFATTSEEDLERMLSGFQATGMAGGHSHTQMLRRYKDVLLFNPGSIGMPFEYSRQTGQVRNPPWAEYALL
ncbi:MAG: metallophosphoesterase, partial [Phycisphaerae bacterium]|nr:metallophosphoesterase [Phycisphaerae bacterium]